MKRTIAIVLIAVMALTVVSSAGVVTAASWGDDHGKNVDDHFKVRDRDDRKIRDKDDRLKIRDRDDRKIRDRDDRRFDRDPCIIKIFVKGHFDFDRFNHRVWIKPHWEFINICRAHEEHNERIW